MCGIVGYTGPRQAAPVLLEGLKKLEYRGYDSAGLAIASHQKLEVKKAQGRLQILCDLIDDGRAISGHCGVGHTRWATHGAPSDTNAHPHLSHSGRVAVVHNGIVENYLALSEFLIAHGYSFCSDTDTEVISQLLDYLYKGDPIMAAREAMTMLEGSFALGVLFHDFPDTVVAMRKDSPLVVGLGDGENFIASDIPALLKHTRRIVRLKEREMALLTPDSVKIFDRHGEAVERDSETITWDVESAEKGGHAHFMIKEILEQPKAIKDTLSPRIQNGGVCLGLKNITDDYLRSIRKIHIIACGSAWHVGCIGKVLLEGTLRIPVQCELASEFRYSDPLVDEKTLCVVVSQSGETLDTLFALREAKARGAKTLSFVNVVGSAIANESDEVLYTFAGPEIAVATTKAYSTQLCMFYLLTLHLGKLFKKLESVQHEAHMNALLALPEQAQKTLACQEQMQYLASLYFNHRDIFFIGRNLDYALALEGSLKLKEISYIHSEAYAAGELKHGTISLIEPGTLVVALCTNMALLEKMVSNIREVKARGAKVIALTQQGAPLVKEAADHVVFLPECGEMTLPSLSVLPLQLFAYYVALLKGCDIDKPRNLAKSVTVE
ncbi:glutamine--fructose-6-phosphate transaminase (isomerizing) [Christensenellaceae bacterium OttesenSCG-928-M15]|nr:glutamine--fructose-6-phosphate transaminase (isomerizing) [Christensenellaceae bacterium OttesenSCG-928-M15]